MRIFFAVFRPPPLFAADFRAVDFLLVVVFRLVVFPVVLFRLDVLRVAMAIPDPLSNGRRESQAVSEPAIRRPGRRVSGGRRFSARVHRRRSCGCSSCSTCVRATTSCQPTCAGAAARLAPAATAGLATARRRLARRLAPRRLASPVLLDLRPLALLDLRAPTTSCSPTCAAGAARLATADDVLLADLRRGAATCARRAADLRPPCC
jgi:hypothetical protein